jgi:hypothetical protein
VGCLEKQELTASILRQLREGLTPSICAIDLPELFPDSEDNDDEEDKLEEGDCILYTVFAPIKEIRAGSTVSQRLAEAYAWNSVPAGTGVPPWAAAFSDVFNKESFDSLPETPTNPNYPL